MRSSGVSVGCRLILGFGAVVLVTASAAAAQTTPPPQNPPAAAAPAQAPPDPYLFTADRAMLMVQVKQEEVANFEAAWAEMLAGLAKSTKPEVQSIGSSMKTSKVMISTAPSPALFIVYMDPPQKGVSYDIVKLLYDSGAFDQNQAKAIYDKLKAGVAGIQPWPLGKVGG